MREADTSLPSLFPQCQGLEEVGVVTDLLMGFAGL